MNAKEIAKSQVEESIRVKQELLHDERIMTGIVEVADCLIAAYRSGHKSLWAGNGGSAADAQHMVGELVNRFCFERPGLPAMALTVDPSVMTAIGNDYSYDYVFARQLEACAVKGDVFVGISTSGNSRNLVGCLPVCKAKGITTVALVGANACDMDGFNHVIHIPSVETPRIQECHTLVGHILCFLVESALFSK